MGFKDMMKSFLYENVEDDDQDLEEEEEEVEVSAPAGEKHSFLRKKGPAAQPAEASPAQPEAVLQPQTQTPAANTAAAPAAASQPESVNPYAAAPAGTDYSNPALYTEPKISAGVPAAASGNFLSRIDDVIEEPTEPQKSEPSRIRKAMQAQREKNRFARQDYSSVISPIFGNVSEDERDVSMLHDAINLPKPVDTLEMIEIISPMYGSKAPAAPARKKVQPVSAPKAAQPSKPKKAAPGQENHQKVTDPAPVQQPDEDLPAVVGNEEPAISNGPADLGSFLSRKPAGKKSGSSSEGRH